MIKFDQNRASAQDLSFGTKSQESILATNKVLRNTYALLSMTLLFSAAVAWYAIEAELGFTNFWIMLIAMFGSLFLVKMTQNSAWGLLSVFVFTGVFGFVAAPTVDFYLNQPGGSMIVYQALGGTGLIFFSLSGYALVSKKDFSYMGGFLTIGLVVAIVAMIANIFLQIPALSLAISAAVIMIMSGFILFDTSRIINGGETNYISATVSLYLSIFNIFMHLLHLLGALRD